MKNVIDNTDEVYFQKKIKKIYSDSKYFLFNITDKSPYIL